MLFFDQLRAVPLTYTFILCMVFAETLSLNDNNFAGATIPVEIASSATLSELSCAVVLLNKYLYFAALIVNFSITRLSGALNLSRTGIGGVIPPEFSGAFSLGKCEIIASIEGNVGRSVTRHNTS